MANFAGGVVKPPAFKPVVHLPLTTCWLLHQTVASTSKAPILYWSGSIWTTNIRLAHQYSTKALATAAGALISGTASHAVQHGSVELS